MLIQPVKLFNFNAAASRSSAEKTNLFKNTNNNSLIIHSYPSGYYIPVSFSGGKSMDLAETKTQLDKYGKYSEHIKEAIEKVLAEGNPDNKTLIDIHLEQYSLLDKCGTLEEAKELYPEFKDVLSDSDIEYQKDSFIDKVKNGEVTGFDSKQDVSLQLLQLYWGKGFSLNTLKDNYAGQNIFGVFEKLNIPRVDRVYGRYLKLSDKNYNERYTAEISRRMTGNTLGHGNAGSVHGAMSDEHKQAISDSLLQYYAENPIGDERKQKISDSLKAYYAGNPMSDEQKQAISEGLLQYYSENPEKIAEQSAVRKKFYEENPDEKEKFSQILLRAWAYKEAGPIKKSMSEFMKKPISGNEDEIVKLLTGNISTQDKKNLQAFWDTHEWEKQIFSVCMKKSWARQNELSKIGLIYEPVYTGEVMPRLLKLQFEALMKNKIPDFSEKAKIIVPNKKEKSENKSRVINSYYDTIIDAVNTASESGNEKLYTAWRYSITAAFHNFMEHPQSEKEEIYAKSFGRTMLELNDFPISEIGSFITIVNFASENGDFDFLDKLDKTMAREYEKLKKHAAKQQKKLNRPRFYG